MLYANNFLSIFSAVDTFAIGCIIYFDLSPGNHPFGEPIRRDANIVDGISNLSDLEGEDEFIAKDLVLAMINNDYKLRYSIFEQVVKLSNKIFEVLNF